MPHVASQNPSITFISIRVCDMTYILGLFSFKHSMVYHVSMIVSGVPMQMFLCTLTVLQATEMALGHIFRVGGVRDGGQMNGLLLALPRT